MRCCRHICGSDILVGAALPGIHGARGGIKSSLEPFSDSTASLGLSMHILQMFNQNPDPDAVAKAKEALKVRSSWSLHPASVKAQAWIQSCSC